MKLLRREIENVNNEVELYVIADTHIGSSQFNEPLLNDLIYYILEKPNRYVILNGDIVDCTFKDSKGNIYENEMTPQVALSYAVKMLSPLAKANRILCTTGGNHDDDRSMRLVGISIAQQLAVLLEIPDLYSPDSVVLQLSTPVNRGKTTVGYIVFVNHGNNGGGGTVGAKANALQKMANIFPCADVYIHSHTHSPMVYKDEYVKLDHRGILGMTERLYVNTNAFLKYFNGYGEKRLFAPQSQDFPVIRLKYKRQLTGKVDRITKRLSCEL